MNEIDKIKKDLSKKVDNYSDQIILGQKNFLQMPLLNDVPLVPELNGTNYIMVYGIGTPTENAAELQAAYEIAKNMPRYLTHEYGGDDTGFDIYKGQTFLVMLGDYSYRVANVDILGDDLVDIETLSTALSSEAEAKSVRTTVIVAPGVYTFDVTKFAVNTEYIDIVSLTGNADVMLDGINVTANDVFIKGIDTKNSIFSIATNLPLLKVDNCKTTNSLGGGGGDSSKNISGTFTNNIGGDGSYGGGCEFSGIAHNCIGGSDSFGSAILSGTVRWCTLTDGDYYTVSPGGHVIYCIKGDGSAAENQ